MPASTLYWVTLVALAICVLLSLLRRQTVKRLNTAQQKYLEERKDRELATTELIRVRASCTAAEKEAAAAKSERDAARVAQGETKRALDERLIADEVAQKTIAELARAAEEVRGAAAGNEKKIEELTQAESAARTEAAAAAKKLADVERQRKAAEDERAAVKKQLADVEGKLREREATLAGELSAAKEKAAALEVELASAREKATQTPAPPTALPTSGGGDFNAALDADPYLNRGQKETIRGTYNQFTAKKRSS